MLILKIKKKTINIFWLSPYSILRFYQRENQNIYWKVFISCCNQKYSSRNTFSNSFGKPVWFIICIMYA